MRTWQDKYTKEVLGSMLSLPGWVSREYEIVAQDQRADMIFKLDPARVHEWRQLGVLGRMVVGEWWQRPENPHGGESLALIELFSRPPGLLRFADCLRKQLMVHHDLVRQARAQKSKPPPWPRLWMISTGVPRALIREFEMQPMDGWPGGFWRLQKAFRVHLVVVCDLPDTLETLPLRLVGRGAVLGQAIRDVGSLPADSWLRRVAGSSLVAWRRKIFETLQEDDDMQHSFFLPETEKLYAEWEQEVRQDGRDEGYKDGRDEGYKDGERALLARQLVSRFGELSAGARQRIDTAEREDIERWALRVLDARSLDEVLAG
jgi:hypothetical protein